MFKIITLIVFYIMLIPSLNALPSRVIGPGGYNPNQCFPSVTLDKFLANDYTYDNLVEKYNVCRLLKK